MPNNINEFTSKRELRSYLESLVGDYLARGGQIHTFPCGATGELDADVVAFLSDDE